MSYDLKEIAAFSREVFCAFTVEVVLSKKNQNTWQENTFALNYFHSEVFDNPSDKCTLAEYALSVYRAANYLLGSNDKLNNEYRQELDRHVDNVIKELPSTFPRLKISAPRQERTAEVKLKESLNTEECEWADETTFRM